MTGRLGQVFVLIYLMAGVVVFFVPLVTTMRE
jgi:hypothetical protein